MGSAHPRVLPALQVTLEMMECAQAIPGLPSTWTNRNSPPARWRLTGASSSTPEGKDRLERRASRIGWSYREHRAMEKPHRTYLTCGSAAQWWRLGYRRRSGWRFERATSERLLSPSCSFVPPQRSPTVLPAAAGYGWPGLSSGPGRGVSSLKTTDCGRPTRVRGLLAKPPRVEPSRLGARTSEITALAAHPTCPQVGRPPRRRVRQSPRHRATPPARGA